MVPVHGRSALRVTPDEAIAGMRIIGLATNPWDGQWVNRQQLLSRIGRRHAVLYSTGGWFTWDRHSSEWRKAPLLGAIRDSDSVWIDEPPRLLLRSTRFPIADRAVIAMQITRWQRWLAAQGKGPVITHVFHPAFAEYAHRIGAAALIYHPHDWFERMPGWNERQAAAENRLLGLADLVIAPSEALARELERRAGREVRVLPNAADVPRFVAAARAGAQLPPDLAAVPAPRIGYVGQVHPNLDLALVRALASARPEWHFVFVGAKSSQRDETFDREVTACMRLPNVHFLGAKTQAEIPAYTVNMDVNIMCYRLDHGWVRMGYPLKLHEYLASGRPIVSVDLNLLQPFQHVIRIVHERADWEGAITDALATGGPGTPARRMEAARGNSWDDRAVQLEGWMKALTDRVTVTSSTGG
jgi:glycosyltransferase involved in cell wall biosynthesis